MLNLAFWRTPTIKKSNLPSEPAAARRLALSQVKSGKIVKVAGFGQLAPAQRQHLQAYGLLPGRTLQVLAQRPVTMVLVEQTELAFETEVASQVYIE